MTTSATRPKPALVLCIEDDQVALQVRKLLLGSVGYEVLTASSAEQGLEVLRDHPVDLVIADHFLRAKTGTEIAREMKQLKPKVPILIVSAMVEEPAGIEFTDGFLPKGEAPDVLLGAVACLLKRRFATGPSQLLS